MKLHAFSMRNLHFGLIDDAVGGGQDVAFADEAAAAAEWTRIVDLVLEQGHPGKVAWPGRLSTAHLGIALVAAVGHRVQQLQTLAIIPVQISALRSHDLPLRLLIGLRRCLVGATKMEVLKT